ncbi:DUF397 domain-containing protein [Embleya sp. NBC_00896]|uniref:DUF397 domain-containing protein n=1 Tax=Embleya sp. NBC_00896 TaxID=2975961 RepID=UPI00386C9742|nr:DUF397 domain-containing protein [Embleya sp. NBC_00896]
MEAGALQVDRVQREPRWIKSSYTGNDDCVEVAVISSSLGIRDSKVPRSPVISVRHPAWVTLIESLRQL